MKYTTKSKDTLLFEHIRDNLAETIMNVLPSDKIIHLIDYGKYYNAIVVGIVIPLESAGTVIRYFNSRRTLHGGNYTIKRDATYDECRQELYHMFVFIA